MRKLNYLKPCAILAMATLTLGGCMSDNEQKFGISGATAYVVQRNFQGTEAENRAVFTPYINFACNDVITNASLKKGDVSYSLSYVDGTNNQMMQIGGYGGVAGSDTIPNGVFQLTATDAAGSPASLSITFDLDKKLGAFKMHELTYGGGNEISAKWDKVENANVYYLMIKPTIATTAGKAFLVWDGRNPDTDSGTLFFPNGLVQGDTYEIAIAAAYVPERGKGSGTLLLESEPILMTFGTPLEK